MKIIYPKKKIRTKKSINEKWIYAIVPLLMVVTFLSGMVFQRKGYDSVFLENKQSVLREINTELNLYQSNGLSTIFLDIPFDSMMTIREKREEALNIGILLSSDDDYVPASMHYNDEQNLDIKIRLKGDWTDHLKTDKWSFRIHVTEDDGAILGMRRFSLQGPETRNYVGEWGYHQNLFIEGVLTTRYSFVNVVVNGEHKGIYALEESFTEDMLESQERREGIIIRIDEDLLWNNWALFVNNGGVIKTSREVGHFWVTNSLSSEITPFRDSRIANNEVLSKELATAIELLYSFNQGELSADQVVDEELWGRYYAITDLWAAGHSTAWHNKRFYYNPVTGLLEPIAFDGLAFQPEYNKNELAYPFSPEPFFNTPGVQKAYIETLERITSLEYMDMLKDELGDEFAEYYILLAEEYKIENIPNQSLLQLPWDGLEFRRDALSRNLNPVYPIRGNYHFIEKDSETFLQLDLVNLMILPVQINEIVVGDDIQPFDLEMCVSEACQSGIIENMDETIMFSGRKNNFIPVSFLIPAKNFEGKDINVESLSLQVNLYGGSENFDVPIYSNYVPQGIETGVKPSVTLEEALSAHPFLLSLGDEKLAIELGDWSVRGDLVLPVGYNLLISEGTILRFEEESVFLIHGKVDIRGTEEALVLLTAQDESWGGMVILDAPETSTWQYAVVEKMAGISRSGWILTGGITFYESAADISFSVIGNSTTEDALNIIRAPFSFEYVEFLNTPSDAFDGDFTTGSATHCSFHDIQGDAFDVSGTKATVTDSYFINIGDKAISAGEKSDITLTNITIRNVSIGIASKDLSAVSVNSSTIDTAEIAGLATYIKKPQYGPASIDATDIEILNTEIPAICQTESLLVLNGEVIPQEDIDIDALYEQGVLGN